MDSSTEYCRQSLEKNDYSQYLLSLFASHSKRPALWAIGALKVLLENIPGSVSEPTLGYMRLTWWRDQIGILEQGGLTKGQPVLQALKNQADAGNFVYADLKEFVNDYETLIEHPEAPFVSENFQKIIAKILGDDYARYHKMDHHLASLEEKYQGTKWQGRIPFLAFRLWLKSFFNLNQ